MYSPDLHKWIERLDRIITWFDTAWTQLKHYWLVVVAVAAVLALFAVLAGTTTLQSCGCQGPVSPLPTPVLPPPTVTPPPQPGSEITGTMEMWWDWQPDVGQSYYSVDPDADAGTVTVECVGEPCPDGFPVTVEITQSGLLTYYLWFDLEARADGGAVLASTSIETAIPAATEPGTGQYDGAASWSWSPPLPSLTRYELWWLAAWRCDGLPDLPML